MLGLLTLVLVHVLVQLILRCSQLVCRSIEHSKKQAEARTKTLNVLEDKEEEEMLALMTINDYKTWRQEWMMGQHGPHCGQSWAPTSCGLGVCGPSTTL